MSILLAIICAVLLLAAIAYGSMRLTDRKSSKELRRRKGEISTVNEGGFPASYPNEGGVD